VAVGYELRSELGGAELYFGKMSGVESLSEPFCYEMHLLSSSQKVPLRDLVGTSLQLKMSVSDTYSRYFHGVITSVSHLGGNRSYSHFVATVRPKFWLLKQTSDCRIFQDKTIRDIIVELLNDHGVEVKDRLTGTYPKLEYCVQYRESTFDFISRWMEKAGIYYYFAHSAGKHEIVLADSSSSHDKIAGIAQLPFRAAEATYRELESVWKFEPRRAVTSGDLVLNDYDFTKPRSALESRYSNPADYELEQGELYDYPGKYTETDVGRTYSLAALESRQVDDDLSYGEANGSGMTAGGLFELDSFPTDSVNDEYLIVHAEIEIEAVDFEGNAKTAIATGGSVDRHFQVRFRTILGTHQFRATQKTPRPLIGGPQTAVVVGPQGDEIYTDSYGRIKVQFHWDRLGKKDENTTCWLRVAQTWAGSNWGTIFIPRVGQEVVVQFLEGDPDQPLVTGSLYNADQMPPYTLPENMTQSGIKTRSTKSGDAKTFNELRFEDKKDKEQIYLHAERDFDRVVENNDTLKVGFDKKDPGDQTVDIYNNRTVTVEEGDEKLTVKKGKRDTTIKDNDSLTVESGNETITVKQGDFTLDIKAGKGTIQAAQSLTLKVGGSSIKIEPAKITISAPQVVVSGSAKASVQAPIAEVKASGILTLQGSLAKIN